MCRIESKRRTEVGTWPGANYNNVSMIVIKSKFQIHIMTMIMITFKI